MKRITVLILAVFAMQMQLSAQRKLTFPASDNLMVTADQYLFDAGAPYIILFHQENSSRGEFREIAPRLVRMGFNCLAVDLRTGRESNFVQNETAALAQKNELKIDLLDAEIDMRAAMDYIEKMALNRQYLVFGSSFSATLALKAANQNRRVAAVIAFSPGEYFSPLKATDWLKDFDRLTYVSYIGREEPFVAELEKEIPAELLTKYRQPGIGVRGAPALWSDNEQANSGWMSLMMFINKVREEKFKIETNPK